MNVLQQMYGWLGVSILAVGLGLGCKTTDPTPAVPPVTPTPGAAPTVDYKISAQDLLVVDVFGEKELANKECRVSGSGEISFPMIGNVKVAGLTAAEANAKLRELLNKDWLVDPQVTVMIKEYNKRLVSVLGEVNQPGQIELPGEVRWTILDALSKAGGPSRAANKDKIMFTRKGQTRRCRLDDLQKTTDPAKIIYLEPGDVIDVRATVW